MRPGDFSTFGCTADPILCAQQPVTITYRFRSALRQWLPATLARAVNKATGINDNHISGIVICGTTSS